MGHSPAQIFTKFDDNSKKGNIEGLKRTYFGVLLSIELNSKTSEIAKNIKKKIESLISSNEDEIKDKITVGERQIDVTLTKRAEGIYNIKFDESTSSQVGIKDTKDYTVEDLLTLCTQHELTVSKGEKSSHYSVTIKGENQGKSATVGGPGKILIFPQHLSYIKETIEHLEKGKNPTKEFALATGTGKTFIELLVEYLPARLMGVPYVSLAPNKDLVTQKRDDWKKVLSNADIDDIELGKISGGCSILSNEGLIKNWDQFLRAIGLEQLPDIIEALNIGDKKFEIRNGKISIDGKDFVILIDKIQFGDKEYEIQGGKVTINNQEFRINTEKSISLSFDEEHRVAEQELYKYRMELLSALFPTLFLSATPSIRTHRHIKEDGGLLKTLSLKDKMKSGVYGTLGLQVHKKLKNKDLAKEYSNGVEEYVDFKPEKSDKYGNANLTDDELKKEVENYLYKNVQSVIGEPALILAESNKQIDNLKKMLGYNRNETLQEQSTGSKFADFLCRMFSPVPDYKLITKSKKFALIIKQVAKRFNITKEKASEIVKEYYDFSNIADYSTFRVMHGIIENTLSCLTGLSKHELDEKRSSDLEGLVKAALDNNYDLETYVENQGVKSNELKDALVQQMQSVIDVLNTNKDSDLFTRLVRNWNQDKKLHILMPSKGLKSVPKKLVNLLSENNDAVVRDYLEYHEVEESKIDEFCRLGKEVCAERREFKNSLSWLSSEEQDRRGRFTPLGENEKKLLEELGKALGMTLQGCDDLTYNYLCGVTRSFNYYPHYEYNKEKYPLKGLEAFCYENKYKVKLKNLGDFPAEDLKSKLCDYIGCQPLEQLKSVQDKLSLKLLSCNNQGIYYEDLINLDTYQLKESVSKKNEWDINYHKKNLVADLNQKQLTKLAMDHLSKDELKDLYEVLLEEENDYHALCRMGLVGNDINPTKVQGYNDINLQHVGMLIDLTSTDLNKPAQLIQAPGRLRCLNSNRHSAFFCYSNGELSFDISLLKRGDYISAYNRSVAKLSNQQAYGDKLATEVINYINQEIKSLKRIDDLASQSISIALSSFIEVYNTNQHNFSKSKKEFIGILEHARKKLYNYEKELRDNGDTLGIKILKMLLKALIIVGYLYNRFTYYLETRDTYNSFLKKVNELKNDPNVDTYAHIIAEYSIKNVKEINLLSKRFFEIYQQREKPQDETDTKSFNNYLEHINACLKHPVHLNLFDKITSPLMKGDYLLKLLNQLYPGENNQDKVERLRTFRKNLKDKSFQFTKDDLSNIEQIQSYLGNILGRISALNAYYYNQEGCDASIIPSVLSQYRVNSIFGIRESEKSGENRQCYIVLQQARAEVACERDLNELEVLSQRENIKLVKEAADYVISPLLGDSSKATKKKQGSEEDKAIINSVVAVAGKVKDDLKKVEPFIAKDIMLPSTECVNAIVKSLSKKVHTDGGVSFVYRGK
ncbi:DEAD/DEAH box helicase family protein [Wolbachia endosymbiont of Cantharis cryptica]|uniref:DEAD/DEAH box helicase family protein n=1 Tax=Wolbachia endosymbiont of Cantharis cryptica TaxID=3066132 RepID=UPI00376EDD4B